MAESKRDMIFTIFAVCFFLIAISNFSKPLQLSEQSGFVLFGERLTGTSNMIWGPVFGVYLLVYAFGIWNMKRFAVGMAHAYALYVVLNLFLYWSKNPQGDSGGIIFGIVYSLVAAGIAGGAAFLLTKRKTELS